VDELVLPNHDLPNELAVAQLYGIPVSRYCACANPNATTVAPPHAHTHTARRT
jgi:hypothetical protein